MDSISSLSFLPYARQSISEEEIAAVAAVLRQDWITRGPEVVAFEEKVAHYCGAKYAVAFSSGTAALYAAYFAAQFGPETLFFTTPNTFIATAAGPYFHGVMPRFVDLDRDTGNLDLTVLQHYLDALPKEVPLCVTPVHFSGIAVDMARLQKMLKGRQALVIEDAAHAIGSRYPTGERVGSCVYSDMAIFSFHPAKTITTGEGGMVTVNDPLLYRRLKLCRDNGIERASLGSETPLGYYEVEAITGNFHLTSIQAALGLGQMERIERFAARRRALVHQYRTELADQPGIRLFTDRFDAQTAFHLFVVQIDFNYCGSSRTVFMQRLRQEAIGAQVHYIPLYHHPVFSGLREEQTRLCPETEKYYSSALSLPLYFDLKEEEVSRVTKTLKRLCN